MIREEELAAAAQMRAWASFGTILDLFTQTMPTGIRVRITSLDVVERAGASFIQYELELVEVGEGAVGPPPVDVFFGENGGLLIFDGRQVRVAIPTPAVEVGQQGPPQSRTVLSPATVLGINPTGAPQTRTVVSVASSFVVIQPIQHTDTGLAIAGAWDVQINNP